MRIKSPFAWSLVWVFGIGISLSAEETVVTVMHTGGMRGRHEQLQKAGEIARQIKQDAGGAILLDSGNSIGLSEDQFKHPEKGSITVDLMNRARYDAWTLGGGELDLP